MLKDADPSDFRVHCLAWLAACSEEELPVALFSGGPRSEDARYHVLARRPRFTVRCDSISSGGEAGGIHRCSPEGEILETADASELSDCLRNWGASHQGERQPFDSGYIGYFAYDLAWLFEYGIARYLPKTSSLPDLHLGYYEEPLILDRERGTIEGNAEDIDLWFRVQAREPFPPIEALESVGAFHREDYEAAVERVRKHCQLGDVFQADLSRRISLRVKGTPLSLFAHLTEHSPAPFSAYLGLGQDRAVVSSSPEEFVRKRGRALRARPIKGTRPRGRDEEEDALLKEALLDSEKDLAELTMIVDLMRNDLGRVSVPGSVRVSEFPKLLALPQVHHLLGTIESELREGFDFWDLLEASFPPGSISGAPKPRAIEILETVERCRRGVYTGAIGYIGSCGNAQLSVAIRTAEWDQGMLRFGVGGGITVRSDAAAEFEETKDKARGLALALGIEDLN